MITENYIGDEKTEFTIGTKSIVLTFEEIEAFKELWSIVSYKVEYEKANDELKDAISTADDFENERDRYMRDFDRLKDLMTNIEEEVDEFKAHMWID